MAQKREFRIVLVALALASCATPKAVSLENPVPPPPEARVLESPLPFRIGITRWEPGKLSEAFARRLRASNLFTEVYYPLESGAEMDAAIEFEVHREYKSAPKFGETLLEAITMGMSSSTQARTYRADIRGDVALRVGERTLRKLDRSVQVTFTVQRNTTRAQVEEVADENIGDALAAQLVEELCKDTTLLAADIAAGPEGKAP